MSNTPSMQTDIVISGAGPAGLCLAQALAHTGLKICLIEQQSLEQLADPPFDGREIALTQFSAQVLKELGVWQRITPHALSPLRDAKVMNGASPFSMTIGHQLSQHSELGWLVSNHLIRKAALEAVQHSITQHGNIQLLTGEKVVGVRSDATGAELQLASGPTWRAQLMVAADSRFSETRRAMGISANMHDFGKTMLVCCMTHEQPHDHAAWEWFGYGQTLALLPMNPDPHSQAYRSSVVLTLPSTDITPLMSAPQALFEQDIQARFAYRLGHMNLVSTRHSYPLVGVYPHRFVAKRFATVGDAAVGMHPVTAHGFNFGLLGINTLAKAVSHAHAAGQDIAADSLLAQYEKEHCRATKPLYLATQLISTLYTNDSPPARLLRETALRVGQALVPFKRAIAASLTGTP